MLVEAVERACERQRLYRLLVARLQVHSLQEVEYVLVLAVLLSLVHDGFHSALAHTLDAAESESYSVVGCDGEVQFRLVDVRSFHFYVHGLALLHELLDILDGVLVSREVGSHVLGRVMRLEVACLICHPCVASGVRLVECVRRELLPVRPYLQQNLLVVAVLLAALNELRLQVRQHGCDLLTHRLTE